MTDRPILFSGPMIRALLSGRKTQTRRAIKPQPSPHVQVYRVGSAWDWRDGTRGGSARLPYAPGDRLWVREAWADDAEAQFEPQRRDTYYRADPGAEEIAEDNRSCGIPHDWRPSIHMHRWRSRLTLIVTDVRVQRLQEISEADARAEGVESDSDGWRDYQMPATQCCGTARDSFRTLWDSLNAKRGFGWDANPWVGAVTFNVHRQNIDSLTTPSAPAPQSTQPPEAT